jgi:hypothetical protein
MATAGHWDSVNKAYYINISVSLSTGKATISITNSTYRVDFTQPLTIRNRLGFNSQILSTGDNIAANIVQITNISSINIECSICTGSYINGKLGSVLYTFPSYTVPVGYKIIERITFPVYLKVELKNISSIRFRIIDENGNLINFNGEQISLACELRQI